MPDAGTPGSAGAVEVAATGALRRALDPAARAAEILFGLIMVLTFTLSLGATAMGRTDVEAVLLGALGCNLAWGLIDAVMYLLGARAERGLDAASLRAIRAAESPAAAHARIAAHLPAAILPALGPADFERMRLHLVTVPDATRAPGSRRDDYLAALAVFLLVTLCLVPVAVPFLLVDDARLALRISNLVALALLFLTGFAFGRYTGRPWRVGFSMVAIGVVLVAVAMALGG